MLNLNDDELHILIQWATAIKSRDKKKFSKEEEKLLNRLRANRDAHDELKQMLASLKAFGEAVKRNFDVNRH